MSIPCIRAILATVAACYGLAASADTLLVVGAVPVSSGDARAIDALEAAGQPVTVVRDSASTAASANGMDLVVISNTVNASSVGNKFKLVATPVIAFKPAVYDNLGLTGLTSGTDFGSTANQTQLRMQGSHALTGGLTGLVTVGTAAATFSWGKPGAAAVIAATLKNNTSKAAIFGYESGAVLANGVAAPARRVALHPATNAIANWNANGQHLFGAAVAWALGNSPLTTVRLLPLGDSITQGKAGHWTYRRDLEAALAGEGCAFDFTGRKVGPESGPGLPLSDRNHEGHSGLRTDQVLAWMTSWLRDTAPPDWALVHIGTNDVLQGTGIAAARTNISGIIDKLRTANPRVGILLAQVIPNLPANESDVVALNDAIAALAAQKHNASSPVVLVDQYSGYSTFSHNYDQIHPNDAGEAKMAQRWLDALLPRIPASCGP